ncbi:MAG: GTP cyclohydrolase II [Gammaproteobacteria bacterium]
MKILSDDGAPGNVAAMSGNGSRNGSRNGSPNGSRAPGEALAAVEWTADARAGDERARIAVERATDEFDRGRAVAIEAAGVVTLAVPAEAWEHGGIANSVEQGAGAPHGQLTLALSARRASALKMRFPAPDTASGELAARVIEDSIVQVNVPIRDARPLAALAAGVALGVDGHEAAPAALDRFRAMAVERAGPAAVAAVGLAKQARLLPCAILDWPARRNTLDYELAAVRAEDVLRYNALHARSLKEVARARVPLSESEQCLFVLFGVGSAHAKHLAIVVGEPELDKPVPLRLHSACLTGDVFASLRCDCGSQLRQAVDTIAREGGGVLLYLPQEGRGIGLANKLRAYRIQDTGLDTLDADALLGFSPDEREYGAAVSMLEQLGVARVRLLTNNPHKMQALAEGGVEVVERLPLIAAVNRHNRPYLEAKAERAGHMLPMLGD